MCTALVRNTPAVVWRSLSFVSSFTLARRMSDHLDRTAHSFREPGVSDAEVVSIKQASETVRLLTLKVADPTFMFKAGQWVDMFIPMVLTVGGFSMSTAPQVLTERGQLGLAVKYSSHPPAYWVHTQCSVGSKVHIRVGGDKLIYDPRPGDPSWNVLLIAGGIGINPLVSMLHHTSHLHISRRKNPDSYAPGRLELLYSAASKSELIFKDTIEDLISQHSAEFAATFFATKDSVEDAAIERRRINAEDIKMSLSKLKGRPLKCYICGPPPMIADMEDILRDQGIREDEVFCEKWW